MLCLLSVSSSFVPCFLCSITEHIDFATPLQEPAAEPVCNANLPASMHTLDHLGGVANRGSIHYTGESQLKEVRVCFRNLGFAMWSITSHLSLAHLTVCISQVLQNLGKDKFLPQSFEQVGTRLAKVLEKVWLVLVGVRKGFVDG